MEAVDKSIQSFKVKVDEIYQLQLKEIIDSKSFDTHDESSKNEIVDPTDGIQEDFLEDIDDDENVITEGLEE
ncbi:hypothetical protein L0F63_006544 [Massospora cicadina]|nr:hypothetical protein L0F63_006544 [Massospora cicadina]